MVLIDNLKYNDIAYFISLFSWSRSGRKLISASTDWTVGVWDVLSGECDKQYRFPGPLTKVQSNPRNK